MTESRVTIREYTPADRPHLAACLNALMDHMVRLDPWRRLVRASGHSAQYIPKFLKEVRENSGFILIAEVDGEPAGAAVAWVRRITGPDRTTELPTRVGFLSDLSVLPAWRGQGIGSRLIAETERRFRADGCDQFTLGVFYPNVDARRLYERRGFTIRGMFLAKELGTPQRRWPAVRARRRSIARRKR